MTTSPEKAASRLDPEAVSRRDFLGMVATGAAASALLFAVLGMLKLPKAAVLSSPSKKFKVNLPETLAPGTPFIPPGRSVALFKDADGIFAISTVCTHLGCIVKNNPEGFECPCHGSRFSLDGSVVKGPAPKALAWRKVTGKGNALVVDEGEAVPAGTKVMT